jgi:hypothetical protein
MVLVPRLPQPLGYHAFADTRRLLGISNALDVLSNGGFLVAGLLGVYLVQRRRGAFTGPGERIAWRVAFLGVFATGVGSGWYHLAPDNASLVWDRLPMAVSFMAVFAALLAERVDDDIGRKTLAPLCILGVGSVLYWHVSELRGAGDLRPYLIVQFVPLASIPAVLALFPARRDGAIDWMIALGLYGVAKVLEVFDAPVLDAVGVSGHTLKHVVAACGTLWLGRMLLRRDAGERATWRAA